MEDLQFSFTGVESGVERRCCIGTAFFVCTAHLGRGRWEGGRFTLEGEEVTRDQVTTHEVLKVHVVRQYRGSL